MRVPFGGIAIKYLLIGYYEHAFGQLTVFYELFSYWKRVRIRSGNRDVFVKAFICGFLFFFMLFVTKVFALVYGSDVFDGLFWKPVNPTLIWLAIFSTVHYPFDVEQIFGVFYGKEMFDLIHTESFQPELTILYH